MKQSFSKRKKKQSIIVIAFNLINGTELVGTDLLKPDNELLWLCTFLRLSQSASSGANSAIISSTILSEDKTLALSSTTFLKTDDVNILEIRCFPISAAVDDNYDGFFGGCSLFFSIFFFFLFSNSLSDSSEEGGPHACDQSSSSPSSPYPWPSSSTINPGSSSLRLATSAFYSSSLRVS